MSGKGGGAKPDPERTNKVRRNLSKTFREKEKAKRAAAPQPKRPPVQPEPDVSRTLTADDPNGQHGGHAVHFSLEGCSLHVESDEFKELQQERRQLKSVAQIKSERSELSAAAHSELKPKAVAAEAQQLKHLSMARPSAAVFKSSETRPPELSEAAKSAEADAQLKPKAQQQMQLKPPARAAESMVADSDRSDLKPSAVAAPQKRRAPFTDLTNRRNSNRWAALDASEDAWMSTELDKNDIHGCDGRCGNSATRLFSNGLEEMKLCESCAEPAPQKKRASAPQLELPPKKPRRSARQSTSQRTAGLSAESATAEPLKTAAELPPKPGRKKSARQSSGLRKDPPEQSAKPAPQKCAPNPKKPAWAQQLPPGESSLEWMLHPDPPEGLTGNPERGIDPWDDTTGKPPFDWNKDPRYNQELVAIQTEANHHFLENAKKYPNYTKSVKKDGTIEATRHSSLDLPWWIGPLVKLSEIATFILNYPSIEQGRGLFTLGMTSLSGRFADGTLIEATPQMIEETLPLLMWRMSIRVENRPVAYPAYHPLGTYSVFEEDQADFLQNSWDDNVLAPVVAAADNSIMLVGKEAAEGYWELYESDCQPFDDFVELVASGKHSRVRCIQLHPSYIYKFRSRMQEKLQSFDRKTEHFVRRFRGLRRFKATYGQQMYDENSTLFKLLEEKAAAGRKLGGDTTGEMRSSAAHHYALCTAVERMSREEALRSIEHCLGKEERRLYEGIMKGAATTNAMKKDARDFFFVCKLRGMSDAEALGSIRKNLSPDHATLWDKAWLQTIGAQNAVRKKAIADDRAGITLTGNERKAADNFNKTLGKQNDDYKSAKAKGAKRSDLTKGEQAAVDRQNACGFGITITLALKMKDKLLVRAPCLHCSGQRTPGSGYATASLESFSPREEGKQANPKTCSNGSSCLGSAKGRHRDWGLTAAKGCEVLGVLCCIEDDPEAMVDLRNLTDDPDCPCLCVKCSPNDERNLVHSQALRKKP